MIVTDQVYVLGIYSASTIFRVDFGTVLMVLHFTLHFIGLTILSNSSKYTIVVVALEHGGCIKWSRNCLSFATPSIQLRFFGVVGAALFNSLFCVLFVLVLCLWCPMLPVSLDCSFLIALSVFSFDIRGFHLLMDGTIKKQKIHFQDKYTGNKNDSSRSTIDY